jgi:uncharacterized integral membrane protein (TIGR00698 family)
MNKWWIQNSRGAALALVVALTAWLISLFTPSFLNSIILALIFGIIVGNLWSIQDTLGTGINWTSSKLLEWSIVFLAFSINYKSFSQLGWTKLGGMVVIIGSILFLTYALAKKFKCPTSTGYLVGFGTAICGSSAIAALAPGIDKEKEDVAISMAVVNLYGTLGMLFLPLILNQFSFSDEQNGWILGGSLHAVGNVVGAGYGMSKNIGDLALTTKLSRVALLTPSLIFFNFLINRKKKLGHWSAYFHLPWYLAIFIFITLFVSVVDLPTTWIGSAETIGKYLLTIAMAAIGLKVGIKKLLDAGKKGLGFGLVIFLLQLSLLWLFK